MLGSRLLSLFTVDRLLAFIASLAYAGGVAGRAAYVLFVHHPRHHAGSDARDLLDAANRLLEPGTAQTIGDTIWPPGTPSLLALVTLADESLGGAAWIQFALSCSVPLLVAYTALLAAGRRAALVALALASLHFGFVHYGGFFLSEQLFQFAVALALATSVQTLCLAEALPVSTNRRRDFARTGALGAAAGLCWALATTIRPNALPVAVLVGLALMARFLRRDRRLLGLLLGGAVAFVLALAPLADRCTTLRGRFCPVSNNIAMNMVLGQAGEFMGITFRDAKHPERTTGWVPPALLHHGYEKMKEVPFSIYETGPALAWLVERFLKSPGQFFVRAVGNVLDLFRLEYWPDDYAPLGTRAATVLKQSFLLFVIAPAIASGLALARRVVRRPLASAVSLFLLAVVAAVALVAAGSLGEPRYRIPFDGVFVCLAASSFVRTAPGAARFGLRGSPFPPQLAFVTAAALVAALGVAAVVLVSHPSFSLAARIAETGREPTARSNRQEASASSYLEARRDGAAWDEKGNFRFTCEPDCEELLLTFGERVTTRSVELSVDHNDYYRVVYYRARRPLAMTTIKQSSGKGLAVRRVDVPSRARGGFDALGVFPLHGDGRYALGHVRLLPNDER
ncbi:MAG TPA: hypothetical protein VFZ53_20980 [Polyangiaceae bacterium]